MRQIRFDTRPFPHSSPVLSTVDVFFALSLPPFSPACRDGIEHLTSSYESFDERFPINVSHNSLYTLCISLQFLFEIFVDHTSLRSSISLLFSILSMRINLTNTRNTFVCNYLLLLQDEYIRCIIFTYSFHAYSFIPFIYLLLKYFVCSYVLCTVYICIYIYIRSKYIYLLLIYFIFTRLHGHMYVMHCTCIHLYIQ